MSRIIGFLFFIITFPLCLLLVFIGLVVYGNPFFTQKRTGLNLSHFTIIKLRSIPKGAQEPNRWGRFIRKYSLDELFQTLNIIQGNMNFIGPRPLLPEYDELYNSEQRKRFLVKPGVTGWAQIKGRNDLSWEDQFRLDVWYVDNQSFWLDCKILILTLIKIVKPQKGEIKMRNPFDGTRNS